MTTGRQQRRPSGGVRPVEWAGVVELKSAGDEEREAGRQTLSFRHLPDRGARELRPGHEARCGRAPARGVRHGGRGRASAAAAAQRRAGADRRP